MSNEMQWPSTGSDAGNVLSGMPLGDLLSGICVVAGFSIDYERLPQAITDSRHAAEFFRSRAKVAEEDLKTYLHVEQLNRPKDPTKRLLL